MRPFMAILPVYKPLRIERDRSSFRFGSSANMKFAIIFLLAVLVALSLTFTEAADAQKPTGPPPKGFSGRPPHGFTGSPPPSFSGSPPPGFTGKPKGKSA
ncbi:hypothetical protein OESDEN_14707 [Oesophagostomum dentatum]|uniref:Uncharacterized protein n=1 Tax=Oesophagostomum dentatum TaxID=61180 RepID=A0A0B1SPY7_OESDE|nr:hypothetical protein OESDEN_14707 [Oesophagostomum dentatum]